MTDLPKPRIVPNVDRGGYSIIHRGDVFWARTAILAHAVAACLIEERN